MGLTVNSPTATQASLDATLTRILGRVRVVPDRETLGVPVTCLRCHDTALIEYTGGTHRSYGNTLTGSRELVATPENPVYKRCHCRTRPDEEPDELG